MAEVPWPEEFAQLGVYDPDADDARDRLEMLQYLLGHGADRQEVAEAWGTYGWHGLTTLATEIAIRPPGRLLSFDEAVERTRGEPEWVARTWRAFGFPGPRAAPHRFTELEVEMLAGMALLGEVVGEEAAAELARVIGGAMARVAEAGATAFRLRFEAPTRVAGGRPVELFGANAALAAQLITAAAQVFDAVHRRHVITHAYRAWSTDEGLSAATAELVVGFADLVEFTARSHVLSSGELASAVSGFEDRIAHVVGDGGGRLVKLIGDEAMFVADDAPSGCRVALDLVETFEADPALPPLRVGLARGRVITMHGDYFGDVVNLAARLSSVAEPSMAVVSQTVRDAADGVFTFDPLPTRPLKGFDDPVAAYRLVGHRT